MPVGGLVVAVQTGSTAEAVGLKVGDVLTQIDDNKLDAAHPLIQLLRSRYKPSQRAVVSFARGSASHQVELTLQGGRPVCR